MRKGISAPLTVTVQSHWPVSRRSQAGGKFAGAAFRVAAAGFKQPELLQLVFAGIGLKEAL
jgi:hypothetical protein